MVEGRTLGEVAKDLVAYLLVVVPEVASLAAMVPPLVELVEAATVRLLDVVVITRDQDGEVEVLELSDVEELAPIRELDSEIGGLLTERDIELIALALQPASAGLVLVTEDRWAEPLSVAAQRVGGHIVAGERIPASRFEAVVLGATELPTGG
jgi:hypothetical protein